MGLEIRFRGILTDVGRQGTSAGLGALDEDAQLATTLDTLTGAVLARHTQEAPSFAC